MNRIATAAGAPVAPEWRALLEGKAGARATYPTV